MPMVALRCVCVFSLSFAISNFLLFLLIMNFHKIRSNRCAILFAVQMKFSIVCKCVSVWRGAHSQIEIYSIYHTWQNYDGPKFFGSLGWYTLVQSVFVLRFFFCFLRRFGRCSVLVDRLNVFHSFYFCFLCDQCFNSREFLPFLRRTSTISMNTIISLLFYLTSFVFCLSIWSIFLSALRLSNCRYVYIHRHSHIQRDTQNEPYKMVRWKHTAHSNNAKCCIPRHSPALGSHSIVSICSAFFAICVNKIIACGFHSSLNPVGSVFRAFFQSPPLMGTLFFTLFFFYIIKKNGSGTATSSGSYHRVHNFITLIVQVGDLGIPLYKFSPFILCNMLKIQVKVHTVAPTHAQHTSTNGVMFPCTVLYFAAC